MGGVGQSAPHCRRNRIDHIAQLFFTPARSIPLTLQMADSKAIKSSKSYQEEDHTQSTKPFGLVEGRGDDKIEGCSCLVPDPVGIRRDYTKSIFPRTQVRIKSFATSVRVLPLSIMPVKPVAKLYLLGNEKTRRGVANLEITSQRRKLKALFWFVLLSVRNNRLDVDRRNSPVTGEMGRVDHLKNHIVYKPQAPVARFHGRVERHGTW